MEFLKNKKQVSEDELQKRIIELTPEMQAEFLRATDVLLQKESEIFLKLIQESRDEINGITQGIRSDQSGLRLMTSRAGVDDGSSKLASSKLVEFVEKREKIKKPSKLNHYKVDQEHEAVENYLKAVGRHKEKSMDSLPDSGIPHYARPATSGSNKPRPTSGYKIRMDDVQPADYSESTENEINNSSVNIKKNYNKEQEELINKLKEQDTQVTTERERQMKLIEKKKAERQNKKSSGAGGIAANLIDQSRGADEKQLQNKLQQEKAIQERLEKVRNVRNVAPLEERSATVIASSIRNPSQNSLFEESKNELFVRPRTGDNKSPAKTPEIIHLKTPTKTGWSDSGSSRDISELFEISEQYPQKEHIEKKKHKSKKHKKVKESIEKPVENNNIEFITIED